MKAPDRMPLILFDAQTDEVQLRLDSSEEAVEQGRNETRQWQVNHDAG